MAIYILAYLPLLKPPHPPPSPLSGITSISDGILILKFDFKKREIKTVMTYTTTMTLLGSCTLFLLEENQSQCYKTGLLVLLWCYCAVWWWWWCVWLLLCYGGPTHKSQIWTYLWRIFPIYVFFVPSGSYIGFQHTSPKSSGCLVTYFFR